MKLSEAILLGSTVVKNDRMTYLRIIDPECPEGCAIGTGLYAVGERLSPHGLCVFTTDEAMTTLYKHWPWTERLSGKYHCKIPEGYIREITIGEEISTRHVCGEPRESIAAWIASIEPQEAQVEQPQVSEVSPLVKAT